MLQGGVFISFLCKTFFIEKKKHINIREQNTKNHTGNCENTQIK